MVIMADVVATTKSVMGNFSGIFFKWGIPLIALGVGYATGDFVGIADKIKNFDKMEMVGQFLGNYVKGPYTIIAAVIFIMIGTALFKIATIGKIIAMGLFGIALRMIFTAI